MSFNGLRLSLLGTESRTACRKARRSRRRPIGLERLEIRLVLSTWSGLGGDANWSTPGNWDAVPTTGSDIVLPAGAAQLANTDDLGAGISFGSLTISGGGYTISASNGSTASFTSIDSSQDSTLNAFDVPIDLSADTTATVDNSAATLVLGGIISGSFGLIKDGSGTLDLTAANTYTGSTTINVGTLLVNGNQGGSAVAIGSGATLGGVGTVGTIGGTGGTLDPGNPAPGILTDTGDLALAPDNNSNNSTFTVVLDGTTPGSGNGNYSQVQAAGSISLTGVDLSGTLGTDFIPTLGSTYTIINNTGTSAISGTFNGKAEGSVVEFSNVPFAISYVGGTNTNSVVLTELDQSQTAVTFSPAAPVFGQMVTLTATVTGPSGSPTPTGSVQFFNGTTSLGTVLLSSGIGNLNTATLPISGNVITAQYTGDSNFAGSTSPAVTVTVGQSDSTTILIPSTTTPVFGQSVTLSATVQAVAPGAGTPSGTVEFFNGTSSLGSATLTGGTASIPTSALTLGDNSITVQYSGDNSFKGQTSTATTLTVGQASTGTNVTSSPSSPVFGQPVTIKATVIVISPGTGTPTGTVQFMNGSTSLGTATLSSGAASITTSSLPVGSDTISTIYSGDTDFKGGNSTATVTVGQSASSTSLTVSSATPSAAQSVTFTATVAATSPGVGSPTGTINFLDNGTSIGTATLSGGVATLSATLPIAVNSVTAQYAGDANFSSSVSTAVTVAAGTANEQWLNQVFLIELNRPITSAEASVYDKQLAAGRSRLFVVNEIAHTREARFQRVQDSFNLYLGRDGTPAEVNAAVKTAQVTGTSVQAAILGSKLFMQQSGTTFHEYYAALFTAVFGYTFPAPFIEHQLSDGVSPIKVAQELLDSNQSKQVLLTDTYNTVQQRDPTQPEIVLYVTQMNDDGLLLREIVAILLASKESFIKATSSSAS